MNPRPLLPDLPTACEKGFKDIQAYTLDGAAVFR